MTTNSLYGEICTPDQMAYVQEWVTSNVRDGALVQNAYQMADSRGHYFLVTVLLPILTGPLTRSPRETTVVIPWH
jgi:hypothetical protein